MRKSLFILLVAFLCASFVPAQGQGRAQRQHLYSVAFYNLENLFDTLHDEGKNDYDFLPSGRYAWGTRKYEAKLKNLARVLSQLSRDRVPQGPACIGVAEVENRRVLADLLAQPSLSQYKYVHYEGPDRRGIDCALLYDTAQFRVHHSRLVLSTPYCGDTTQLTRGFLIVDGELAGDHICFIVNHWPSRGSASPVRVHAARQVRALTDSLFRLNPRLKLIVMGDLNDDPMDESLQTLGARKYPRQVKKRDFYNPWWVTLEDDSIGTLCYRGKWNLFDQILLTRPLLKARRGLRYRGHEVFRPAYLFQHGEYEGYPLRTHGGRKWLNGYSDHLPTIVYLRKK